MENQLQVVEVQGVHGYIDDNGVAWLNVEDVARGLGFVHVEEKVSPTSGRKTYESIRWERINGYLAEYDYPPVKAGDFLPENIFYLLAMKANNEAAKTFQMKIANEILPSIRKTGSYSVTQKTDDISSAAILAKTFSGLAVAISKLADVEHEKIAIEREKLALEREKFNVDNSDYKKNLEIAKLLRELASASGDESYVRGDLVRASAKLIMGEDFFKNDPRNWKTL